MSITAFIAEYATRLIDATGYPGVFILMTMESMVFPVPSEAVMPFAGFLVAESKFSFAGALIAGTIGSIVGSLISYYIGAWGGHPFVNRFGKYLLLDREDLEFTGRFFKRFGDITILICRFIPVVRHLISIPAGVARMNLLKFLIFTIIGAGLWNAFLTWTGLVLRQNWESVMKYSHIIDIVVVAVLAGMVAVYVWKHWKKRYAKRQEAGR
jgi:membrane protein DedA with SNARE-associated domain